MKVFLLQDVPGSGKKNQIITASDGYARNFLLPKKLGVEATPKILAKIESQNATADHNRQVALEQAREQAEKLKTVVVDVHVRAGENGRLFGSVTSQEVADGLAAAGYPVDKKKITMPDHIRQAGEYGVDVVLFTGVHAEVKIRVLAAK